MKNACLRFAGNAAMRSGRGSCPLLGRRFAAAEAELK